MTPIEQIKLAAECSLFFFARAILGLRFFTEYFHKDLCEYLQNPQRPRKLALAPRDHGKTMAVKAMILHMLIQPKDRNCYFPGISGNETRIVIAGETSEISSRIVRVCKTYIEKTPLIHQLWPHTKPGDKWTDQLITLERTQNYSEPTIEAVGTESALASRHIDALFEEDIYTFRAMMSPTLSQRVTTWHQAAEGILDEYENTRAWEVVTGTPWAQNDTYHHIIENESDQSADLAFAESDLIDDPNLFTVFRRSCIENNQPLWPERFSLARIRRIERRLRGTGLFELNFLCDYEASTLTDYQRGWLRYYELKDGLILVNDNQDSQANSLVGDIDMSSQDKPVSPLAASIATLMDTNPDELDITSSATAQQQSKSISLGGISQWLKEVMR